MGAQLDLREASAGGHNMTPSIIAQAQDRADPNTGARRGAEHGVLSSHSLSDLSELLQDAGYT